MNDIEAHAKKAAEADLDRAVGQLPTEPPKPTTGTSLAEQLEKLANLHSKGLLTDDEFATAKAKLLN